MPMTLPLSQPSPKSLLPPTTYFTIVSLVFVSQESSETITVPVPATLQGDCDAATWGETSMIEVFVVTALNGLDGERLLLGESRGTCCLVPHLKLPTGDEADGLPVLRHDSTVTRFPLATTYESDLYSALKEFPTQVLTGEEEEMEAEIEEALIKLLPPPITPVKSANGK
jgi:hypothetical protein